MNTFLYLCIVAEMVLVNLTTVHICMRKRCSTPIIVITLLLFSVALAGSMVAVMSRFSFYGNGNGAFVLAGFLYLIPLRFLYREKFGYILEVVCSAWIYTLLAFMLSLHTAKLIDNTMFPVLTFFIQTGFYLITIKPFLKFIHDRLLYALQNINYKMRKYLRYGSILCFLAMTTVNVSFVVDNSGAVRVLAIALLGSVAYVSYSLIYEVTMSSNNAQKMQQIAMTDYLTGLQNRSGLLNETESYMQNHSRFFILYMDLDNFKSINDQYGHLVGDNYLFQFAEHTKTAIGDRGTLYRVSGDEFLLLCLDPEGSAKELEDIIHNISFDSAEFGQFLGVSVGSSCYPEDGENFDWLISLADQRMYDDKRKKAGAKVAAEGSLA